MFQKEDKKYFKRGDLAAKEAEEYYKKNKRFKIDNLNDVCCSAVICV